MPRRPLTANALHVPRISTASRPTNTMSHRHEWGQRTRASSPLTMSSIQTDADAARAAEISDEQFSPILALQPINCCIAGLTQDSNSVTSSIDNQCEIGIYKRCKTDQQSLVVFKTMTDVLGGSVLQTLEHEPHQISGGRLQLQFPTSVGISSTPANCGSCQLETCCCWSTVHPSDKLTSELLSQCSPFDVNCHFTSRLAVPPSVPQKKSLGTALVQLIREPSLLSE